MTSCLPKGTKIPLVDLTRQHVALKDELEEAAIRVIRSGQYILGPEEQAFEREFADYLGVSRALGVGSGTDALYLILKALALSHGDEVITTPFTFIATADAVVNCGATPVFADIEPRTFNIDPESVARAITPRTRAILAVHLFGQPADMDQLVALADERGLYLVEDCAQAAGAVFDGQPVGTMGTAGAFSFFPTKNLGCAGDGGVVTTNDNDLAEKIGMLRGHGSRRKYYHEAIGINSRLDEIQAALLRVKLKHLDLWNDERRSIAQRYGKSIDNAVTPFTARNRTHVYHQYTIMREKRDAVALELSREGISSAVYYPVPLHQQPCFGYLSYTEGDMPASERAASRCLSLPMFPGMTEAEIDRVSDVLRNI